MFKDLVIRRLAIWDMIDEDTQFIKMAFRNLNIKNAKVENLELQDTLVNKLFDNEEHTRYLKVVEKCEPKCCAKNQNKRCDNTDFHDKTVVDCFFSCKKGLNIKSQNNLDQIKITKTKKNNKPVVNVYDQLKKDKEAADANKKLLEKIAQKTKEDQAIAAKKKADLEKRKETLREEVNNSIKKFDSQDEAQKKMEEDYKNKLAEIKRKQDEENKKLEEESKKKLAEIEKTREEFRLRKQKKLAELQKEKSLYEQDSEYYQNLQKNLEEKNKVLDNMKGKQDKLKSRISK